MICEYSHSNEFTKKGWLDYLFYKRGMQIDFYVCGTYGKPEERNFTKWRTYLDCVASLDEVNRNEDWRDRTFFEGINQREILSNEVVLDIEEPSQLAPIIDRIKIWGWEHYLFETGSRGYHIYLFFAEILTPEEKKVIILKLGADVQKHSKKSLIALENCPHWKTGKLKREIIYE